MQAGKVGQARHLTGAVPVPMGVKADPGIIFEQRENHMHAKPS